MGKTGTGADLCRLYFRALLQKAAPDVAQCVTENQRKVCDGYALWRNKKGKWVNYGECSYDDKKKMIYITDLPYDVDFESFEKLLNKMIEKEEIKDWENYSDGEDKIEYRINIKKSKLLETLKGKDVINKGWLN